MAELVVLAAAEEEYAEALGWYAAHSPNAALGFEAEVERALREVAAAPNRFPRCDDRHR